ncbi:MAG: hypothetical protein V9E86_05725 [Nitrosomonas sp.]
MRADRRAVHAAAAAPGEHVEAIEEILAEHGSPWSGDRASNQR